MIEQILLQMEFQNYVKLRIAGKLLSTALIKWKSKFAVGVLKNFVSRQTKILQKKKFLFPDWQETMDPVMVLEFMKIRLSNLKHNANNQ